MEAHGLKPLILGAKEGLALINGTQLISSFGAEAVVRAENITRQGDVVAALTLEVLKGTSRAFDSCKDTNFVHLMHISFALLFFVIVFIRGLVLP